MQGACGKLECAAGGEFDRNGARYQDAIPRMDMKCVCFTIDLAASACYGSRHDVMTDSLNNSHITENIAPFLYANKY